MTVAEEKKMKMRHVYNSLPKHSNLVLVLAEGRFALARYMGEYNWHVQPFKQKWYKSHNSVTHWRDLLIEYYHPTTNTNPDGN